MVSNIRFILIFSLLFLFSCGNKEFVLEFELSEDINENFNATYYSADKQGGITVQAVASIMKGKCVLTGMTKSPTIIYLYARKFEYPLVIYVSKGEKIKITGDNPDPLMWTVEGNAINKDLSSWRTNHKEEFSKRDSESIDEAIANYIENNEKNPASLIILLSYFNRKEKEGEYVRLFSMLKEKSGNEKLLKVLAISSQVDSEEYEPGRMLSLILRSNKGGNDTIRNNGKQPVLLCFWNKDSSSRRTMVDSLKNLLLEYPDSVNRVIADICFDIDSVGWKNEIRRDSLRGVYRMWAPMGNNDPELRLLKVPRLPFYIVFDKEGKQIFRGNELTGALQEFRNNYKPEQKEEDMP